MSMSRNIIIASIAIFALFAWCVKAEMNAEEFWRTEWTQKSTCEKVRYWVDAECDGAWGPQCGYSLVSRFRLHRAAVPPGVNTAIDVLLSCEQDECERCAEQVLARPRSP